MCFFIMLKIAQFSVPRTYVLNLGSNVQNIIAFLFIKNKKGKKSSFRHLTLAYSNNVKKAIFCKELAWLKPPPPPPPPQLTQP